MPSRLRLRRLSIPLLLVAAVLLAGCGVVQDGLPTADQGADGIGSDVTLGIDIGADGSLPIPASYSVAVAVRLPDGVSGPATFDSTSGAALHLVRSTSYATELQRLEPAPTGTHWEGWLSDQASYVPATPPAAAHLALPLTVPASLLAAGGPLSVITMEGNRTGPPGTPDAWHATGFDCGLTNADLYTNSGCITSDASLAPVTVLPLRDMTLSAPATTSLATGVTTSSLAFTATTVGSGLPSGQSIALTATTDVPGGTATPSTATIAPSAAGTSATPVVLTLPVIPAGGTFHVTLTGTSSGGTMRSATATVTVAPAPALAPAPAPTPTPAPAPGRSPMVVALDGCASMSCTLHAGTATQLTGSTLFAVSRPRPARVTVNIVRVGGGRCAKFTGRSFVRSTCTVARHVWLPTTAGTTSDTAVAWSFPLPKLARGTYRLRSRGEDAAGLEMLGYESGAPTILVVS